MLMDAKKQLELMKKDTKPFINYTPPNYYRPQLEYETDEQYKQRQDSYKEYKTINVKVLSDHRYNYISSHSVVLQCRQRSRDSDLAPTPQVQFWLFVMNLNKRLLLSE